MNKNTHNTHQTWSLNPSARDFVCGDIHGQYDVLMALLKEHGFDPSKDRLLALGDLVDRGFDSLKCLRLVKEPWFHSIMGNHEEMMLDALAGGNKRLWYTSGGDWYERLTLDEKCEVRRLSDNYLCHLPLSMTLLGAKGFSLGLVHAEPPGDWHKAQQGTADPDKMLWGRRRIQCQLDTVIYNVDAVFVGHSSLNSIDRLGNVYYLDTGAGFVGGKLTLIEITKKIPDFIHELSHRVTRDAREFDLQCDLAETLGQPLPGFRFMPVNPTPKLLK